MAQIFSHMNELPESHGGVVLSVAGKQQMLL
jgi:hypothetical protein